MRREHVQVLTVSVRTHTAHVSTALFASNQLLSNSTTAATSSSAPAAAPSSRGTTHPASPSSCLCRCICTCQRTAMARSTKRPHHQTSRDRLRSAQFSVPCATRRSRLRRVDGHGRETSDDGRARGWTRSDGLLGRARASVQQQRYLWGDSGCNWVLWEAPWGGHPR